MQKSNQAAARGAALRWWGHGTQRSNCLFRVILTGWSVLRARGPVHRVRVGLVTTGIVQAPSSAPPPILWKLQVQESCRRLVAIQCTTVVLKAGKTAEIDNCVAVHEARGGIPVDTNHAWT